MKNRIAALSLALALSVGLCAPAQAADSQTVEATLNAGITVTMDGTPQTFHDAQGAVVLPVTYNGTTYLPVRAVSALVGLGVEWEAETQTVKLTTPEDPTPTTSSADGTGNSLTSQTVPALLNGSITVTLDGEAQTFHDAQGAVVLPLTYNGTTYLPVRAVCGLVGLAVEWVQDTGTVKLGNGANGSLFRFTTQTLAEADYKVSGTCSYSGTVGITAHVKGGEPYRYIFGTASFQRNGAQRLRITREDIGFKGAKVTLRADDGQFIGYVPPGVSEFTCKPYNSYNLEFEYEPFWQGGTTVYDSAGDTGNITVELITYQDSGEVPDGGIALTSENIRLTTYGATYVDGIWVMYSTTEGAGGNIRVYNEKKYSTLVFTAHANDLDHWVIVGNCDTMPATGAMESVLLSAGDTKTFTVDISDINTFELSMVSGTAADGIIYDVYLY